MKQYTELPVEWTISYTNGMYKVFDGNGNFMGTSPSKEGAIENAIRHQSRKLSYEQVNELFFLLRTGHIIYKDNKFINSGDYKGCVNNSCGFYYTNDWVDDFCTKLNDINYSMNDFKINFPAASLLNAQSTKYWLNKF